MNLRQLSAFREVMRTGSVTSAAANLDCTQPAITNLIHRLEKDIGQTLFYRRNRRLSPTPEAHYLMNEATEILSKVHTVETYMRDTAGLRAGELRIACMPIISDLLASQFIADYIADKPDVSIYLSSQPSRQVYDSLASQIKRPFTFVRSPVSRWPLSCPKTPPERDWKKRPLNVASI